MKEILAILTGGMLCVCGGYGPVFADEHMQTDSAVPVEIYACRYADGKGPADLDAVVRNWNKWADQQKLTEYTAWTLTPFYFGQEQDFDILWLGVSPTAKSMGRAQDVWLATGGKVNAEFERVTPCHSHGNFASLQFKAPPEGSDATNFMLTFSDCSIADGMNFGRDVAPALEEWATYRGEHGSAAGMWVLFPAYGGGGEEFDFKFVTSQRSNESMGADWDQYAAGGWKKAEELFSGKLDCDSSRVYNAQQRRAAVTPE